jgi:hypothetical protein
MQLHSPTREATARSLIAMMRLKPPAQPIKKIGDIQTKLTQPQKPASLTSAVQATESLRRWLMVLLRDRGPMAFKSMLSLYTQQFPAATKNRLLPVLVPSLRFVLLWQAKMHAVMACHSRIFERTKDRLWQIRPDLDSAKAWTAPTPLGSQLMMPSACASTQSLSSFTDSRRSLSPMVLPLSTAQPPAHVTRNE